MTEVVELFAEEFKKAAGIPVYVGWREVSTLPTAVLQLRNAGITPLDMAASKHLVDISLQLDIYHTSPRARDEAADKVIQHIEDVRQSLSETFGVVDVFFEAVVDVGDRKAFRKMLLVRVRLVG